MKSFLFPYALGIFINVKLVDKCCFGLNQFFPKETVLFILCSIVVISFERYTN